MSNPGYGWAMIATVNKPPWVPPRIKAAPKIRQVYWCDLWRDARLPEMWKTRPVIVVSYKNTLTGACLVLPVQANAKTTTHGPTE
jgi:mRNA interferase MazF